MKNQLKQVTRSVTDNTKALQSHLRDRVERMSDQVSALRCLSGLLVNQRESGSGCNLEELTYLLDPIVDNLKDMEEELMELFYRGDLIFIRPNNEPKPRA